MPVKPQVRLYLAQRQISQATLARELGITPSHLSQIISGHETPSLRLATRLEHLTGIPAREFVSTL